MQTKELLRVQDRMKCFQKEHLIEVSFIEALSSRGYSKRKLMTAFTDRTYTLNVLTKYELFCHNKL